MENFDINGWFDYVSDNIDMMLDQDVTFEKMCGNIKSHKKMSIKKNIKKTTFYKK